MTIDDRTTQERDSSASDDPDVVHQFVEVTPIPYFHQRKRFEAFALSALAVSIALGLLVKFGVLTRGDHTLFLDVMNGVLWFCGVAVAVGAYGFAIAIAIASGDTRNAALSLVWFGNAFSEYRFGLLLFFGGLMVIVTAMYVGR